MAALWRQMFNSGVFSWNWKSSCQPHHKQGSFVPTYHSHVCLQIIIRTKLFKTRTFSVQTISTALSLHTYSECHRFPSIMALLLPPVSQNPLQQHLGQLLLPGMLGLHQSDALCQRCPVSTDQPIIKFI